MSLVSTFGLCGGKKTVCRKSERLSGNRESPRPAADRAAALRQAFAAAHQDPQFLAEAKTAGLDVTLVRSNELRRTVADLSRAPPDAFDHARRLRAAGRGG